MTNDSDSKDLENSERRVQYETKKRTDELKKWDDLKQAGKDALGKAGHRLANGEIKQRRRDRNIVSWQEVKEVDSSYLGYESHAEWRDKAATQDEEGNALEPVQSNQDQLSEDDKFGWDLVGNRTRFSDGQVDAASDLLKMLADVLTPKQLEIYLLKVEQGLSEADIADRLKIGRTTVQTHWELVEKKLRKVFAELRGEEKL